MAENRNVRGNHINPKSVSTDVARTATEPVANVKWYGAEGDGVSDDTQAFQDATAAASRVYAPEGEYLVTDSTALVATEFVGDGAGNTTVLADNTTGFILSGDSPRLAGVTINGQGTGDPVRIFSDCSDATIEHCVFENAGSANVQFDASDNSVIEDCTISNCRIYDRDFDDTFLIRLRTDFENEIETENVDYAVRNCTIEHCYLYGSAKDGVELVGPGAYGNVVKECTLEEFHPTDGGSGGGGAGFDAAYGAHHNTFRDCTVRNMDGGTSGNNDAFKDIGRSHDSVSFAARINEGNRFINCKAIDITGSSDANLSAFRTGVNEETIIDSPVVRRIDHIDSSLQERAFQPGRSVTIQNPLVEGVFYGIYIIGSGGGTIQVTGGRFENTGRLTWITGGVSLRCNGITVNSASAWGVRFEDGRAQFGSCEFIDIGGDAIELIGADATASGNHYINVTGSDINADTNSTVNEGVSYSE